jgi:hypothetical protein
MVGEMVHHQAKIDIMMMLMMPMMIKMERNFVFGVPVKGRSVIRTHHISHCTKRRM